MSNVMSQDTERLVSSPQSKLLSRGSSERRWTAACQLVCGILSIGCGITIIPLELPRVRNSYRITGIESLEHTAAGIWGGLVFVATAVPYIVGRKNKAMVGIYLAFCILSLMIALLGVILSAVTIEAIIEEKYFHYDCESYNSGCCFDKHNWGCYGNSNHYSYHYYEGRFSNPTTPLYDPLTDYESLECQSRRQIAEEREQKCWNQLWLLFGPHQIVLGILIAVLSVEVFASAYGACASVISLCDCTYSKKRNRDLDYFPISFGQPVNANSFNGETMLPASGQIEDQGKITAQLVANSTVPMSQTAAPFQAASSGPSTRGETSPLTQ